MRGARSRPGRGAGLEARRGATRRAVGFSLGVRGLRRVGVGGPQPVQQLVDHRLGRAFHTVGDADAAGERGVGGVARGVAAGVRLAAQLGQAGQHQREVDRPAHRRAHPHVAVLARGPGQPDREVDPAPGQPADRRRDRPLTRVVLVAEHDPAHPVGDGLRDPRGAHGVERVHRGDQPEVLARDHRAQPRDGDLALGEHGDEDVERLLRDAVELLHVQQAAPTHRRDQRAVDEVLGAVALGEHLGRVELADQPRGRELGVALDEHDLLARVRRDGPQQGGLAGAGRPLQHHVPPGRERDGEYLALATQADDRRELDHGSSRMRDECTRECRSFLRSDDQSKTTTPFWFLPSCMSW